MSNPNEKIKSKQSMILAGLVFSVIILVAVGLFVFDGGSSSAPAKEKPVTVSIVSPGGVNDRDQWRALQAAKDKTTDQTISELRSELRSMKQNQETLQKQVLEADKKVALASSKEPTVKVDPKLLNERLPAPNPQGGQKVLEAPTAAGATPVDVRPLNTPAMPPSIAVEEKKVKTIEVFDFESSAGVKGTKGNAVVEAAESKEPELLGFPVDDKAKRYAVPKGAKGQASSQPIDFLPAGTFVRTSMLNGVDAPTGGQAQSNPLPIVLHVLDTANLANKHKLDIKDCRFVVAAWGDLSSERTMGRTETLTCVINGQAAEMSVKGQVMGEDGKVGVRGRLVTKQGSLLANALLGGSLSGIGRAFQQSAMITSTGGGGIASQVDPDRIGTAAIGGGFGSAGNQLAQYYLKAADKLYPVIETDGGRVVEVLITKGAVYNGQAIKKDTYQGMLRRTGTNARDDNDD